MANFIRAVKIAFSAIGAALGAFIGGLDGFIIALIVCVSADYITGVVAAYINKELSSTVGFKGLLKKILIFIIVAVAHTIDKYVIGAGTALRTAVVCYYISNEGLSLLENTGRIGVPLPQALKDALEQLNGKGEKKTEKPNEGTE